MAQNDMRYYETFYGIHTNHWSFSFGDFTNWHKLLVQDYISEDCLTEETSEATLDTNIFVYQNHMKKTYFIEGVITGQITCAASGATCLIESFQVTVGKIHASGLRTDLFASGWQVVNDTLAWDGEYGIGEERVYWFQIDAWEKEKLDEYERIYVKIEVQLDDAVYPSCELWHSNDSKWEDIKIEIPFIM
jgi:hypothetical protein